MDIVTDESLLRRPNKPVSVKRGLQVGKQLHSFLLRYNKSSKVRGIGLAAPQIGIHEQVCVLNLKTPLTLINPRIIDFSPVKIAFKESCLSFPNVEVNTYRHLWVTVQTDNLPQPILFGDKATSNKILESVLAQHEIAHLAGLLIFDFTGVSIPHPFTWFLEKK
jgi:peptide deformylase